MVVVHSPTPPTLSWLVLLDLGHRATFCRVSCPVSSLTLSSLLPGAQIIDLMMLVIDVTKGMQTQSAECLVIGQIACQKLVVVLNKTDLLPEGKRQAAIDKMTKKMQKTLENTK